MQERFKELNAELEVLRIELRYAPVDRKPFVENKIKEIEYKLNALENAWLFDELED